MNVPHILLPRRRLLNRGFILTLSVFFFATNCLFADSSRENLWREREKTIYLARLPQPQPISPLFLSVSKRRDTQCGIRGKIRKNLVPLSESLFSPFLSVLPLQYGTVRKIHAPKDSQPQHVVLHIQDIHLNAEAQANIAKTLGALIQDRRVAAVAVEGAFGELNLKDFQSFSRRDTIAAVADSLYEENKISGAVYSVFTSGKTAPAIMGVDDRELYQAHVRAYQRARSLVERNKEILRGRRREIEQQKSRFFHKGLKRLDEDVQKYRRGEIRVGEYIKRLLRRTRQARDGGTDDFRINTKGRAFPQISLFLKALDWEASLNFQTVETQRAHLIRRLAKRMTPEEEQELLQVSVAYRAGKIRHPEFYEYLKNLSARQGVRLDDYPAVQKYVRYALLADQIQADCLLAEVKKLEEALYAQEAQSQGEKRLIKESRQTYLIGKLLDFALTPEEWNEYRAGRANRDFSRPAGARAREEETTEALPEAFGSWPAAHTGLTPPRSPGLAGREGVHREDLAPFESFYRIAEQRDQAISKNLLSRIANLPRSTPLASPTGGLSPSFIVLVTGGFHSHGIDLRLNQAKIATVSFVPKVTKVRSEDGSAYLGVFSREKTPLEKLFDGDKLFLAPVPASEATLQQASFMSVLRERWMKRTSLKELRDHFHRLREWSLDGFRTSDSSEKMRASLYGGVALAVGAEFNPQGRFKAVDIHRAKRGDGIGLSSFLGSLFRQFHKGRSDKVNVAVLDALAGEKGFESLVQLAKDPRFKGRVNIVKGFAIGAEKDLHRQKEALEKFIKRHQPNVLIVRSGTKAFKKADPVFFGFAQENGVKAIIRAGAGVDNIDMGSAAEARISVIRTHGNAESVADLSLHFLMMGLKPVREPALTVSLPEERWRSYDEMLEQFKTAARRSKKGSLSDEKIAEIFPKLSRDEIKRRLAGLQGKTIGLLGFGAIPRAFVKKLHQIGEELRIEFKILVTSPSLLQEPEKKARVEEEFGVSVVEPEEIFSGAQVISLHMPGGEETRHFLKPHMLQDPSLKIVINTSRDSLIDPLVWETIRLQGQDPGFHYFADVDFTPKLTTLMEEFPNQIDLTPHIGASTRKAGEGVEINTTATLNAVLTEWIGSSPALDFKPDILKGIALGSIFGAFFAIAGFGSALAYGLGNQRVVGLTGGGGSLLVVLTLLIVYGGGRVLRVIQEEGHPIGRDWGLPVDLADLSQEEERDLLEIFQNRLTQETQQPGSGNLPLVAVITDPHGTIDKFDALLLDAIRSVFPNKIPLMLTFNRHRELEDQLADWGVSEKEMRGGKTVNALRKAFPQKNLSEDFQISEKKTLFDQLSELDISQSDVENGAFLEEMRRVFPEKIPRAFKLVPHKPLRDQLSFLGLRFEDLRKKIFFHNLGDFMDRGPKGVQVFNRSQELIRAGLSSFVIGNHDFWQFLNLQGYHLPWYDGFNFRDEQGVPYQDQFDQQHGSVEDVVRETHQTHPETRTKSWWAERLVEYTQHYRNKQSLQGGIPNGETGEWDKYDKVVNGEIKQGKRQAGTGLYVHVSSFLSTYPEYKELWNKLRGVNSAGVDIWTGVRAVGNASVRWWEDLLTAFQTAYEESRKKSFFQKTPTPTQGAWESAISMMKDDIIPTLKREVQTQLLDRGNWWWRVFEAINYRNYTSAEWWAKDWAFHKGWGPTVFGELNDELKAKGVTDPKFLVDQTNYFNNGKLQEIAAFFKENFTLYVRDIYQNVYMHAFLPIDQEGRFHFIYQGVDYRGTGDGASRSVWEGLEKITAHIRQRPLRELREAFTLINSWYADNTTQAKPPTVAEAINQFEPKRLALANGFHRLFVGHIPFHEFSKLSEDQRGILRSYLVRDPESIGMIIFADHGMGKRFQNRGAWVGVNPEGIKLRGYPREPLDGEPEEEVPVIEDNPSTIRVLKGDGQTGTERLFENPPLSRDPFLRRLSEDVTARLDWLRKKIGPSPETESDGPAVPSAPVAGGVLLFVLGANGMMPPDLLWFVVAINMGLAFAAFKTIVLQLKRVKLDPLLILNDNKIGGRPIHLAGALLRPEPPASLARPSQASIRDTIPLTSKRGGQPVRPAFVSVEGEENGGSSRLKRGGSNPSKINGVLSQTELNLELEQFGRGVAPETGRRSFSVVPIPRRFGLGALRRRVRQQTRAKRAA